MIPLRCEAGPEYQAGRRILRLSPPAALRLGVKQGDIVELVSRRGAPLRAWVEVNEREGDDAYLSADGLAMLGAGVGESVEIRLVRRA